MRAAARTDERKPIIYLHSSLRGVSIQTVDRVAARPRAGEGSLEAVEQVGHGVTSAGNGLKYGLVHGQARWVR